MSSASSGRAGQRKKWAPKSFSGCQRCKKRRVKCDETKPQCQRCLSYGVECSGYSNPQPRIFYSSREQQAQNSPVLQNGAPLPPAGSVTTTMIRRASQSISPNPPAGPYRTWTEWNALQYWVRRTAPLMSRSDIALHFWSTIVPKGAWEFPSVRHALIATSVINQSLSNREDPSAHKASTALAIRHANVAIQTLVTQKEPSDEMLMTIAVFWLMDLLNGNWKSANLHLLNGARIAKQVKQNPKADHYIASYLETLAHIQLDPTNATAGGSQLAVPRSPSTIDKDEDYVPITTRAQAAIKHLQDVCTRIEAASENAAHLAMIERSRVLAHLEVVRQQIDWLLGKWIDRYGVEEETSMSTSTPLSKVDTPTVFSPTVALKHTSIFKHRLKHGQENKGQHASTTHSQQQDVSPDYTVPMNAVLKQLDSFVRHQDDISLARFEVLVKRSLPGFVFATARTDLAMRQDAIELLELGKRLREGRVDMSPNLENGSLAASRYAGRRLEGASFYLTKLMTNKPRN